ncbi:MAG: peptidoglycan-binding protein [Clostridiales bacterium]|jgi:peptidoglycan hydrolase-like protein with peptidoglycan-binding domain|nr:peptidoglycan-binding protein [Clostridiales bacterium]
MGRGFFSVNVQTAGNALPVDGAYVRIFTRSGEVLYDTYTDKNGRTGVFTLYAPSAGVLVNREFKGVSYETYDVIISHAGYRTVTVRNAEIVDAERSILPVALHPVGRGQSGMRNGGQNVGQSAARIDAADGADANEDANEEIDIPPFGLLLPTSQLQYTLPNRILKDVYIPEYLTVHLGTPNNNAARNVQVGFEDYIKNVASSEIFPTWPLNAILANIHCQVTFALNRIYTEWYRSRGYNFDITNSTAYDQYYVEGRNIFESISNTVDQVFNVYARRVGFRNPYFTQYCNGTTSVCSGLSQWGTVSLAEQGLEPVEILRYYYDNDLELVSTENIARISESYPGYALRIGSAGAEVALIQNYLRRIRINYPLIPRIDDADGSFGADTDLAVRTFQDTFNLTRDGIVGRATWYKISFVYVGVIKLGEIDSEGERIGIGLNPPTSVLRQGMSGEGVLELQFILDAIEPFYTSVPPVIKDSYFGYEVQNAVTEFQRYFGLTADGVVGPSTWNMLYSVYNGIFNDGVVKIPDNGGGPAAAPAGPPYPGAPLIPGDGGPDVRLMQQYLSAIRIAYNSVLPLVVNGNFDGATEESVRSFQNEFMLPADGAIGPETWGQIVRIYNLIKGLQSETFTYPGEPLRLGSVGPDVKTMQLVFGELRRYYPQIPEVAANGLFDESFRNAVIAFQRYFGLAADGVIGSETWRRAIRERSNAANGTA